MKLDKVMEQQKKPRYPPSSPDRHLAHSSSIPEDAARNQVDQAVDDVLDVLVGVGIDEDFVPLHLVDLLPSTSSS